MRSEWIIHAVYLCGVLYDGETLRSLILQEILAMYQPRFQTFLFHLPNTFDIYTVEKCYLKFTFLVFT
jgi:hypothetical protein